MEKSCMDCKWGETNGLPPICRYHQRIIPNFAPCDEWSAAASTPHPDTLRLEKLARNWLYFFDGYDYMADNIKNTDDLRAYIDNLEE